MAKGMEKHKERMAIVSSFGKDLARRAKSKCEICEAAGVKLVIYEVEPVPTEPVFEQCIMVCEPCHEQICVPRKFSAGEHWRCLAVTVWSEVPVVQVVTVRLLKRQAKEQAWARETLEGLFLEPEIEEWVTKGD
jgi:protein PhnA